MFELWARERSNNQYIFIKEFENENMIYTIVDILDREKYKDVMVINNKFERDKKLIFYQEFPTYQYKKKKGLDYGK